MPLIGVEDAEHTVTYVNPAFCLLVGRTKASIPMIGNQCAQVMDRVDRTGQGETHAVRENSIPYSFSF